MSAETIDFTVHVLRDLLALAGLAGVLIVLTGFIMWLYYLKDKEKRRKAKKITIVGLVMFFGTIIVFGIYTYYIFESFCCPVSGG